MHTKRLLIATSVLIVVSFSVFLLVFDIKFVSSISLLCYFSLSPAASILFFSFFLSFSRFSSSSFLLFSLSFPHRPSGPPACIFRFSSARPSTLKLTIALLLTHLSPPSPQASVLFLILFSHPASAKTASAVTAYRSYISDLHLL